MTGLTDMDALKARLKSMWMAGDYGHFAQYLERGALEFLDTLDITPGQEVLDVAGQAALASDLEAHWSGANLAGQGETRVEAECLEVVAVRA